MTTWCCRTQYIQRKPLANAQCLMKKSQSTKSTMRGFFKQPKNPGNLATGLWTMMGFRNMIFLSNYGDFVDIHVRCGSFPGCQAVVSGGGLLQDLRFFPTKNHVSLLVMSLGGNMHLKKFSHVSDNLVTDHPPLRNGFKK